MTFPLMVAAATLAFQVPAGATATSYADPAGDPDGAGDARADITRMDINYAGGTVTVGLTLANPEAPTSRNWIDGDSGIYWTLLHPNGQEYEVNFSSFDDGLYGSMFDEQEKEVCRGQVKAAYGADKRYTATFPASCLGNPANLLVTADMTYDDIASGRGPSEDLAPDDEEFCCAVTP
jgi:hypothetical protein